jgi:hypothetical protein
VALSTQRVKLYLYSPSGPSWQVTGLALLFTFINTADHYIAVFGLDAIVTHLKPEISQMIFSSLTAGLWQLNFVR